MNYYDIRCEDFFSAKSQTRPVHGCCHSCHEDGAGEYSPPPKGKYDFWTAPVAYVCCTVTKPATRDEWAGVLRAMRSRLRKETCKS